jgi:hypothetical protein
LGERWVERIRQKQKMKMKTKTKRKIHRIEKIKRSSASLKSCQNLRQVSSDVRDVGGFIVVE